MTFSYDAARANLSHVWQQHPNWQPAELAVALGSSQEWVKKWLKRLREELAGGVPLAQIFQGHSRARKSPPATTHALVVEQILAIRDQPPEGLRRVPGQEAIRYYLEREPMLQFFQLPVPSCKTMYRVLTTHERIAERGRLPRQPLERSAPMSAWQIDLKDISTVGADPAGKRQHVVESLNIIDSGTSVLLAAHVHADFTAETALEALALTLTQLGCPKRMTLDRDSRLSSAVRQAATFRRHRSRFCACVGIEVQIRIIPSKTASLSALTARITRSVYR